MAGRKFQIGNVSLYTQLPNYCAKDNLQKKSTCDLGGKSTELGMPTRASKAKPILVGIRG